MQSKKGIMRLLSAGMYVCMYVCAGFSQLHAKDSFTKSRYFNSTVETIGLVHRIYQCKQSLTSPLLAASASQQSKLPTSVKPVAPLLLKNCESSSTGCPGTLRINGDISITNSDTVAITTTTSSLSDITVDGTVQISIPTGGSFTIDGTTYTRSPIAGLIIAPNSTLGVRIDCSDVALTDSYGVYIGENITLDVQGPITMSGNIATSANNDNAHGVIIGGTITATAGITMNSNQATSDSSDSFGVLIIGTITATAGSITINSNTAESNNGSAYGVLVSDREGSAITATVGAITMNGNQAEIVTGDSAAYGVNNGGTITVGGVITMSSNQATSSGGFAIGVISRRVMTAGGAITMSNNQAASSGSFAIGVSNSGGVIKTDSDFIISVSGAANQSFNSAFVEITNIAGTTPLPFTQFTITIDTDSYGSTGGDYADMQAAHLSIVLLSAANQS